MSQELKTKILDVLKSYPVGSVATIKDGKPWVRYMAMQYKDDLTLYSATFASSRKIDQIEKNNNVHVTFGCDPKDWEKPYVQVVGKAEVLTDLETKKWCWHDILAQFFKGPEDPGFVVLKVTPTQIEYMTPDKFGPEVLKL